MATAEPAVPTIGILLLRHGGIGGHSWAILREDGHKSEILARGCVDRADRTDRTDTSKGAKSDMRALRGFVYLYIRMMESRRLVQLP
jgi:hypothetical protein